MEMRRKQGVKPREQYLKEQRSITERQLNKIREVLSKNPKATRKELAEVLGVSVYRVDKLKKQL